ncbi:di-heme oxidoredictase family protein [Salinarimonas ramus]|uniref:Thiol oxidoreductase n=1 Tax=Salinarimonas ramus TaxID=690164 RepID=A0A917QHA3_9HYPH|nr:di-heme oxidoredictase family protein [Salinarimonas ramus]GGK50683.1 thiol oxidoreductase [Salinarimonas ramus]
MNATKRCFRTSALHLAGALAAAGIGAASAEDGRMARVLGEALFERAWVPAPSSTKANDGLGPLFNARACVSCHAGLDRAPVVTDAAGIVQGDDLVLRLSDEMGAPDPVYGAQIQTGAVPGLRPEGLVRLGATGPAPHALEHGPLAPGIRVGGRIAPSLCGIGRLDAVPDEVLAALADPHDADGDGISGRFVGRFGWKAQAPDLASMVAIAFATDLGLSTTYRPAPQGDCPTPTCAHAPHGGDAAHPEITDEIVAMVSAYLEAIPPPPAPAADPIGEALFAETGCAACHVPALPTPNGPARAFTDLLVHDMGEGLGGGATEPGIAPGEWRTAPLVGLSRTIAKGAGLLHDGRAQGVAAAIALHGGEAASARAAFSALDEDSRENLLRYVEAL